MRLDRVTLAVTDMDKMVSFYNAVFDAGMKPTQKVGDLQFYMGEMAGMELLFCPNEIAEVDARQNRHQMRYIVDDLEGLVSVAKESGAKVLNEITVNQNGKFASIRDPEENSIEFIQRA